MTVLVNFYQRMSTCRVHSWPHFDSIFLSASLQLIKSMEWATMMMGYNKIPKNGKQNVRMNRPYNASFLMNLAPIEIPESQLIKNGAVEGRFVDMF